MRNLSPLLLLLLLTSFCLYQCASTENSQEQTFNTTTDSLNFVEERTEPEIKLVEIKRSEINLETILARTAAFKKQFGAFHQHIPYTMFVNEQLYFVVATGNWKENNWDSNKQEPTSLGSYKVGLVNELNETIIPIKYDKIYNMGGVAPNLMEVELNGKLGAYDIVGNELLAAEFDGIYPYSNARNSWVQVRKGDQFGWLSTSGHVSMDVNSHSNQGLFRPQPVASLLTNWSFDSKSERIVPFFKTQTSLTDKYQTNVEGLLIFPSYLYHLELVPEFRTDWDAFIVDNSGNGETQAKIQTARKTGKNKTLVSAFKQYFSEPRGYYEERSDIITLNDKMEPIDKLSIEEGYLQGPCSDEIRFHFIDDNTLEACMIKATKHPTYNMMTSYAYHHIGADGKINPIKVNGLYPFTRIIKITDVYFKGCFSRDLTAEEKSASDTEEDLNFANSEHLSIEDLDLMRNEIYAAHGYIFKNKKWKDYFGKQPWYKAQFNNVDDKLTEIEKHNITAILNQKKKMEGHEAEFINTTYGIFVAAG